LIELRDGKDQQTTWLYDEYCRQIEKRDHTNGLMFSYTYDANGRLLTRADGKGAVTGYAYDPVGNLTNIDYVTSPKSVKKVSRPL
jgi:YD repeat-containing protein